MSSQARPVVNGNSNSSSSGASKGAHSMMSQNHSKIWENLRKLTIEVDLAYTKKDFPAATTKCVKAIEMTRTLPEPMSSSEAIRLKINLSNCYMMQNDHNNVAKTIMDCTEHGEKFLALSKINGKSEAVLSASDMLQTAYLSGVQGLLHIFSIQRGKEGPGDSSKSIELQNAVKLAEKAKSLAQEYMHPNDPMQFKSLRAVALTKDASGNSAEAEKHMLLAFNKITKVNDIKHVEMQQFISDEYTKMVMRRRDPATALIHAKNDYAKLQEMKLKDDHLMMSDSLVRLAQIQMCFPDKFSDARTNLSKALEIRQKQYDTDKTKIKVTSVADVMVMLSRASESDGNTSANMKLLKKAKEMYNQVPIQEKMSSPLFQSIEEDIARISGNRIEKIKGVSNDNTVGNKVPSSFAVDDGIGRMNAALKIYEESRDFDAAIPLLEQAIAIFIKQYGPEHNNTKTCQNNLGVLKSQEMQKLWIEVINKCEEDEQQQ